MKQVVLFKSQVPIKGFTFQAKEDYSFQIVTLQNTKWLYYQRQKIMTLSLFAILFVDQGHAQWIDDEEHRVA
jgi:hypothetical protein